MEDERGFKVLSIAPCSHQDQSQRVNRWLTFPFDLRQRADFMPVSDVSAAMFDAVLVTANGVPADSRGARRPRLASGFEITS